ncbi:hypothetical protein [Methanofollis tationis]|uniref:Uncharacterized protein n=1 Tax=Methanofollis tationis TaxID=81417 RepID=A0A7K4HPY4_9EURY|nr:hypothetical protein [Methanofollis tationis]NVO66970.1 hypothetical protein [Methanofollis tationis]
MDVPCEIRFNTRSINSIDLPESVEVHAGDTLVLKLKNEGSPLHLTLSTADAARFTDFFHENLYLERLADVPVVIRDDVFPGMFAITVITGYGTNRSGLKVAVRERPAPVEEPPQPLPPPPQLPVVPFAIVIVAALLFIIYVGTGVLLFEAAAFVVLILGVIAAWFLRR